MTPVDPRYCCRVQLTVSENQPVCSLTVDQLTYENNLALDTVINAEIVNVDLYEGSYDVVSLADNDQTLDTKNKMCTDDITVRKVPYFETSNLSGGYTVYIAPNGEIVYGN